MRGALRADDGAPEEEGASFLDQAKGFVKTWMGPALMVGAFALLGFFLGGPVGAVIGAGMGVGWWMHKH